MYYDINCRPKLQKEITLCFGTEPLTTNAFRVYSLNQLRISNCRDIVSTETLFWKGTFRLRAYE